jgi:hypothetical protein
MAQTEVPSINRYFENITDPRRENKRHNLIDIITIAICAVICNADNYCQWELQLYHFRELKSVPPDRYDGQMKAVVCRGDP